VTGVKSIIEQIEENEIRTEFVLDILLKLEKIPF